MRASGWENLPNVTDGPDGVTYGEYHRQVEVLQSRATFPTGTKVAFFPGLNTGEWYHHPRWGQSGIVTRDLPGEAEIEFGDGHREVLPKGYLSQ